MEKEYCALVFTGEAENLPEPGLSVKLEDYLLRDGRKNTSAVVPSGTKDAKRAELVYEVKEKKEKQALVNIRLLTGRHHQIRVQRDCRCWVMPDTGLKKAGNILQGRE